jgi:hypothetical protein
MTGILDWSHARPGGWYHCSVDTVKRSAGRSAVGAAAYALGGKLRQEDKDLLHDYSRKGGVVASFTVAPESAPEWVFDPQALWNAAERAERRSNSVVAREADIALPHAVDAAEREAIARDIAAELVRRYDVAVTVALHDPGRHGDSRNHHAHFLWTTREVTEEGLGAKTRILDDVKTTGPQEISAFREYVAGRINQALEAAESDERVSALSLQAQGIGREATTHLGPVAAGLERKGVRSERGERNRAALESTAPLDEVVRELAEVAAEITALEERGLDARYGPAEQSQLERAERPELTAEVAATADAAPASDEVARSIEEERAQLAADAAPFEAHLRQDRDIPQYGLGATWWERAAAYGQERWNNALEYVRGKWQSFVESRRDREQGAPEPDERER